MLVIGGVHENKKCFEGDCYHPLLHIFLLDRASPRGSQKPKEGTMKALMLVGERILGSIVLLICAILGIQVEPVDEQLANTKQLVRRRPRYMPSRIAVVVEFSQEAVVFLKKAGLCFLGFALIYVLFCLAFAM